MGEARWGLRQLGVFGHPRCLMLYYCWFSGLLGLCFLDMVTLHFFLSQKSCWLCLCWPFSIAGSLLIW